MKYILILSLLFCNTIIGQVHDYNIRIDYPKDPDSVYVLLTGNSGSFAGRGRFNSLPILAGLLEPFLNLASNANMANGNQTITGDRAHNLGGNDFKYQNLDDGRFVIDYNSSKDSAYVDFNKDTFDILLDGGGGLGKYSRMFLGAANTPEYFVQVDDGLGNNSEINISPTGIILTADSYKLLPIPTSGASTDSVLTINASTGAIGFIDQSGIGGGIMPSDTAAMLDPYKSRRTIYIDPFEGDAGNTGLSEDQAVTSPTDVTILDNDVILLRGGSIFYEEFDFTGLDNIDISRYGGGNNPIIDGSASIPSWTDTSTISKCTVSNSVTTGRIRLYRNEHPMTRAASLADCIATINTYYINQDGNADQASTIIYLNVDDPTIDTWRYTKREYCINLPSGTVTDINTLRALSNNGSTIITGAGNIVRGRADYGSKHNAFLGSGTVDGLRMYQSDATTVSEPTNTVLVGYTDDADSLRINFNDIEIVNDDNDFNQEVALITHGAVDGYDQVTISDSKIKNINLVFAGDCDLGYIVNNDMDNIGRLFDVDASDSLMYVADNNITFTRLNGNRSGVSKLTMLERNLFYYPQADNASGNAAFYHTGSDKILDMFNNVIIVEGRRVIDASSTGGDILANENILVSTATNERLIYVPTGVTYAGDHNIFYAGGANQIYNIFGATTCETLAEWQSVSSQDENSVWLTDEQYKNLWVKTADGYVINPKLAVTDSGGNVLEGYFPDSTRITFHHIFKSLVNTSDDDWYEASSASPTDNTAAIYHDGNVIVGDSIFSTTGKLNIVGRIDQRFPTQGLTNVALGHSSGNLSATGDYNASIGYNSLAALTSGSSNMAIGESSLNALTTGYQNVAIGGQSGLLGNPSASVAIGFQSMRSGSAQNTVAIGYGAAFAGGGNYAVHIGQEAGYKTTGGNNTFIGANAGHENVTGTSNVFIGQNAGYNETGSNLFYVDNSNTANPLLYGNFSTRNLKINGDFQLTTKTPSSASDTGIAGTICWDASYIYICTATNTWKRVAIATW